ncbi:MAG TPA: alkaline phosphatase family protein [Stellaceae bacterium]|jgi:phospholipase C|nr:alkaline phosphatase family protein [Stellaceae bacterium]
MLRGSFLALMGAIALVAVALTGPARADGDLGKVNHIIILTQENHSFDNYFGVLAFAPGSPYHSAGGGACSAADHLCVDGLNCVVNPDTTLSCANRNIDDDGTYVTAFHETGRCVVPDLDHSWVGTHEEVNFIDPNNTLKQARDDGFVKVNDATEQVDTGESPTEDQTIGYYDQTDLPYYYSLAANFAISDEHYASILGPTIPNRFYLMAATSFGHLTTSDAVPPPGGYKPITGTIFDLLDAAHVTWADYFQDVPQSADFRVPVSPNPLPPGSAPLNVFFAQAAGASVPGFGPLPAVSFIDPNFGTAGSATENDEHPPTDIQRGQAYVSQVVAALRNGPHWSDSILLISYDEHGGFYDHARPPKAQQGGLLTPDGINPGQCEDLSAAPASEQPGGGVECSSNFTSTTDTSVKDAEALCSDLNANPTGPYPANCANFDQLGVRIPLIAVSPFAKVGYVSHKVTDHSSMLALIEQRFLKPRPFHAREHLTARDEHAWDMEDMFDFTNSPSLNTAVGLAAGPTTDCTPTGGGGAL